MDKEIRSIARKLNIRVTGGNPTWFWKSTYLGDSARTLRWLQRCAVRRGVLPPAALPEDDPIRLFTECNGTDPEHRIM